MTLTDEEYERFMKAMMKSEMITGKRISVSQFMRDTVLPILDIDDRPSLDKTVSPDAIDTDSKQKNKDWQVFNADDL